jgi:hypothetical protein
MRAACQNLHGMARTIALPYSPDEREALALLFLPFLLVASAVVVSQTARNLAAHRELVAVHAPGPELPRIETIASAPPPAEQSPAEGSLPALAAVPATPPPATAPEIALLEPSPALRALPAPRAQPAAPLAAVDGGETLPPVAPATLDTYEADADGRPAPRLCLAEDAEKKLIANALPVATQSLTREAFGERLAAAAEAQVGALVIYNDRYRSIRYPMGDVAPLFGVCTDVVVRAYRALGVDLQPLVHLARAGSGDTSIDHRRTEVLRRFFAKENASLPVTPYAEDYQPGDIVTYYRPQNRHNRSHIAIVSRVVAPSGRPMVVHNRGWGPQLEDALFVDEITGHYRYSGPSPAREAALGAPVRRPAGASSAVLPASLSVPSTAGDTPATSAP